MSVDLPAVGEAGPGYATKINAAITEIDAGLAQEVTNRNNGDALAFVVSADMTGVADGRSGLATAITAAVAHIAATGNGAEVLIPAGILNLSSVSPTQPTNPVTGLPYATTIGTPLPVGLAAKLHIRGAGVGITTIKLSDNARNVFWINQSADYDTFKNVEISDLTVDNNNTVGRCHILIGSMPAALTSQQRLNYENIDVHDIDILNVPIDPTAATTYKSGVWLIGKHVSALESTRTHSTNVTVERINQYGGDNCVGVCSLDQGTFVGGTNHYYDRVFVRDILHDNTAAGIPSASLSETSVFVCGSGFGDYFEVDGVRSINIGDNCVEIGAMQQGLVDRIEGINPFLETLLFRNGHALQDVASQRIKIGLVTTKITSAAQAVSVFRGRPIAWTVDNSQTFGEFDIECLEWWADGLRYAATNTADIAFLFDTLPAKTVINRLKIRLTDYQMNAGSGTVDASLIDVNATSGHLIIHDLDISAAVSTAVGAGLTYFLSVILHRGSNTILSIDGYTLDLTGSAWTNSTGGGVYGVAIARSSGTSIAGLIRRFRPTGTLPSGIGTRAVSVQQAATIARYAVADCDFTGWSGLSAGRDIEVLGANGALLVVRDVIGHDGVRLGPNGRRADFGNAYTILPVDAATIGVTTLPSPVTVTLPAAANVPVGQHITVADESNSASTNNLTVARAGSDTFTDGSTSQVISANNKRVTVYSTGTQWHVVKDVIAESDVSGLVADLALKAPLASPALTGTPTAPTAAQGTNTTQVATTAMVHSEAVLLAPIASPTFTGTTTAPEFSASGLTGATTASRYVGGTAGGPPTTGTFALGDYVIDNAGRMWVCWTAGTPGSWLLSCLGPGQAMLAGRYCFPQPATGAGTSNTLTNSTLRVSQMLIPRPVTLTRIGAEITGAGESGSVLRLGIWNDNGSGYPSTLVIDAGTIDGTSATVQEITISQALNAGLYWIGGAVQAAPTTQPTVRTATVVAQATSTTTIPTAGQLAAGYAAGGVTGAFSSFPASAPSGGSVPRVFVKV